MTAKRRFMTANATAPTAEPAAPPEPPAATAPAPAPAPAPVRAEPPKPAWDARMSLTLSKEMKRALDIARAEDGIEGTARIRAMIALWESDERIRKRIDRDAKSYR